MAPAKGTPAWAKVRLLVCDVDGVLTDGRIILDGRGRELKQFCVQDGLGFTLARHAGLATAWLSARRSAVVDRRARESRIGRVVQGARDKAASLRALCAWSGAAPEETAYLGDDLVDLPALALAGVAVAVANAVPEIKRAAHYVTRAPGGAGAVREVIEHILRARGLWSGAVNTLLARDGASV